MKIPKNTKELITYLLKVKGNCRIFETLEHPNFCDTKCPLCTFKFWGEKHCVPENIIDMDDVKKGSDFLFKQAKIYKLKELKKALWSKKK